MRLGERPRVVADCSPSAYHADGDGARARRTFEAMMQMKRIDIAALERAAEGITPPA
jgi:hypothetical protein